MGTINRTASLLLLNKRCKAIVFESDEDDGAYEYRDEIYSVIIVLEDANSTDDEIIAAATWVSEPLVFN